jgi:hypothetical protein
MLSKPQISRQGMRRLWALFLLVLSVGPWLLVFSSSNAIAEASLPACCRAHGKHKCLTRLAMHRDPASTSAEPLVSQISEHCPYNPRWTATTHNQPFGQPDEDIRWTGHSSEPSLIAIPTKPSTSFSSRANSKRGPPSPALRPKPADRLAAQQRLPLHWRHHASLATDISIHCPDTSPGLAHPA